MLLLPQASKYRIDMVFKPKVLNRCPRLHAKIRIQEFTEWYLKYFALAASHAIHGAFVLTFARRCC